MACKSLQEVIQTALMTFVSTPGFTAQLKGEFKDFLAHELMYLQANLVREGKPQDFQDIAENVLHRFFEQVTK